MENQYCADFLDHLVIQGLLLKPHCGTIQSICSSSSVRIDTWHATVSVICEASTLIVYKFSDTSGGDHE